MPGPPLLAARGLRKVYGDVVALAGLDLEVREGEAVALVGHNGSGKTTALRLMAGALTPTEGRVEVGGVDLHRSPQAHGARALLVYVPDSPVLYDDLTVQEHLELLALAHDATDDLDERADALLAELGLSERRRFLPGQLSRGMRQKAQLACAFIRPFSVILLDEPVAGLDPPSQSVLKDVLVQAKAEGAGVVLATHQLDFARGLADRALLLADGQVAAEGAYDAVVEGERATALGLR